MDTLEKKSVLERIDCATEQIENVVMSLGLLTLSGIVFANVIARYFFQTAFAWSEELARYVVVWVTYFGISSCARYHTHVGVDLLSNFLKGRAKLVYQALICLISVGLSVYMTYISIGFTIMQYKGGNTSIAIAIPIWLIYLSTNIGFGLMSYVYLRNFMKLCSGFRTGKEGTEC